MKNISAVSDILKEGEVTAAQACYLPYSGLGKGGPTIGWVPGLNGVAVAAGHSCWGICNGPGTGKVISELVCDGEIKSAKLDALDPGKYLR